MKIVGGFLCHSVGIVVHQVMEVVVTRHLESMSIFVIRHIAHSAVRLHMEAVVIAHSENICMEAMAGNVNIVAQHQQGVVVIRRMENMSGK